MDWRGFELHPEIPVGGKPTTSLFPADRVVGMHSYLKNFAAKFGIKDLRLSEHLPNTRRALAMAEYAREQGQLPAFWDAAMKGYWRDGLNVEDPDDLRRIVSATDLDTEEALAAMDADRYLERIDALREEAGRMGVAGIPTFFFGDSRPPVVGCQSYEELERAALRAGAQPSQ